MSDKKPKYKSLLKTAELAYRLAHAVQIACLGKGRQPFEYPQWYAWGEHCVTHEEFALSSEQEKYASRALLHCATYVMAVQIDTALQREKHNRFKHHNDDICIASCIANTIRNAFSHDPFNPVWKINRKRCPNRILEIKGIIRIDTNDLEGEKMRIEDYGGPLSLLKLSEFVRTIILNQEDK